MSAEQTMKTKTKNPTTSPTHIGARIILRVKNIHKNCAQ